MSCVQGLYCPFFSPTCAGRAKACIIRQIYDGHRRPRYEIGMAQAEQFGEMLDWMREQQRLGEVRISAEPWAVGAQVTFDFPGRSLPSWPGITMF